jgi:hypothetical protein
MDDAMPCLERALLPGSTQLMWARLAQLKLLVREGHYQQATPPLEAIIEEISRWHPKNREMLASALRWRARALCQGRPGCAK